MKWYEIIGIIVIIRTNNVTSSTYIFKPEKLHM